MFPDHSGALHGQRGAICLVANDVDSLIGTEAAGLRELDIPLHLLCCAPRAPRGVAEFRSAGITVHRLADLPRKDSIPNVHGPCPADTSDWVRQALEQLHARHAFGGIVFSALGGLGFRSLQARAAGLAFQNVTLAVYLDSCSAWLRSQRGTWSDGLEDLELDYVERSAFERADLQLGRCPELLAHVRAGGWEVRPEARTVPLRDAVASCDSPRSQALPGNALSSRLCLADQHPKPGRDGPRVRGANEAEPRRQCVPRQSLGTRGARVTVCVPHFNLGAFLPRTLESLAGQTCPDLEVFVIDDGSTDTYSRTVFEAQRARYPHFRFLTQSNAGIGATRNRGLAEATGDYFLPMDADNVARPDLVARLVEGARDRPDLAALTCYFLAFSNDADLERGRYRYAYRPVGGPRVLACLRNVYGDATALYRTEAFRAVGGYETDRDSSFEDWEAFVKLAQAGFGIDVLPEYLFYYRHREEGFSRVTRQYANHERVLRRFRQEERLPVAERIALWNALFGFHRKMDFLSARSRGLSHRFADGVHALCRRIPFVMPTLKWLLRSQRPDD